MGIERCQHLCCVKCNAYRSRDCLYVVSRKTVTLNDICDWRHVWTQAGWYCEMFEVFWLNYKSLRKSKVFRIFERKNSSIVCKKSSKWISYHWNWISHHWNQHQHQLNQSFRNSKHRMLLGCQKLCWNWQRSRKRKPWTMTEMKILLFKINRWNAKKLYFAKHFQRHLHNQRKTNW